MFRFSTDAVDTPGIRTFSLLSSALHTVQLLFVSVRVKGQMASVDHLSISGVKEWLAAVSPVPGLVFVALSLESV